MLIVLKLIIMEYIENDFTDALIEAICGEKIIENENATTESYNVIDDDDVYPF